MLKGLGDKFKKVGLGAIDAAKAGKELLSLKMKLVEYLIETKKADKPFDEKSINEQVEKIIKLSDNIKSTANRLKETVKSSKPDTQELKDENTSQKKKQPNKDDK